MSCFYELNGHHFNSEYELDDYLLTKEHLRSKLGDIVFSRSADQLFAMDKLTEAAAEAQRLEDIFNSGERLSSDERKSINYRAPYIGVNKYIAKYEDTEGNLLCPEFRKDEYWERRYSQWKLGNYTEEEEKLFFNGGQIIKIADRQQAERHRALMENKWENQCLMGDAVHSILEAYFTQVDTDQDGNPIYAKDKLRNDPNYINEFRENLNNINYNRRDRSKKAFTDLIDDSKFNDILNKCKELENTLNSKFPGALFFPEFRITGKVRKEASNGADTILGIIDLLVIDKNGCPHIIDYKTSTKSYDKFSSAKQLAYKYQMGTYGKLLAKAGLATSNSRYFVVPIQLADFQKIDDDQFTFSGINMLPDKMDELTHQLRHPFKNGRSVMDNLDEFIETPYVVDISADNVIQNVTEQERILFPGYSQFKTYTDEQIREEIQESGGFEPNPETGKYEFKPKGSQSSYTIVADSEEDLFEKVKNYKEWLPKQRRNLTDEVLEGLKEGIRNGTAEGIEFPEMYSYGNVGVSTEWFRTKMSRYCNPRWKVCDGENFKVLKEFGIITLFNEGNQQFNFVKITTSNPKYRFNFSPNGKRKNLAGAFKTDLEYQSKNDSLMLEAAQGNVELMETMLVINNIKQAFGNNAIVGDIEVMNPVDGFGIAASNKELMYCFNELTKEAKKQKNFDIINNFKNGSIQLATKAWTARALLKDIMSIGADQGWQGEFKKFKNFHSCVSLMDQAIVLPQDKQIEALENLLKQLSKTEGGRDLAQVQTEQSILSKLHVSLYNQTLLALAELKGIDFRQQLEEHDKWVATLSVHKQGLSGLYLDNPGNLDSETLNLLTKLVTQAYQGVRQDMQDPIAKIRQLTENLKKEKNVGWIGEHTIVNQADLYKNMYRDDITDDLVFKNPWSNASALSNAEREYLKYALTEINKNRFGLDPESYQNSMETRYFRVPLAKGDSSAFASKQGLFNALKEKLRSWSPQKALQDARAAAVGVFDKLDELGEEKRRKSENLFEMTNVFDKGETENRKDYIAKLKPAYFESNLETLLMKHQFAYAVQDRIDEVMPMIKAALVHLTTSGAIQNNNFKNDLKYAEDYIRNKIKNESIIDPKYEKAAAVANKIKSAASKMALAFAPVQLIYQTIQGIWNDISLILRKPDGSMAFTFKNMIKAAKLVYSDLWNIENKPTITSLMNELYGINDMDMNTYIDKIKSDQHGIHNLTSLMFKFASRPDYYNRMTIFQAKLIADGALEAHSIKDGKLIYDSKKDKRYAAYLNNVNNPNVAGYAEAKAAYYAAAKQFIAEKALVDEEGNLITEINLQHPIPLPRAYTNQEAESMKSLSDTIYGYYSHEKKSMIQSTLLGSMWMQFKTYWSGKKNQYMQTGGVKLEGQWVPYKDENGQQYYYQVDDNGNVREDLEPITEDTGVPVVRWEGNWKEGILSTVFELAGATVRGNGKETWEEKWNAEDPKLRLAYRSNIKQLAYDLIIWALIGGMAAGTLGDWLEDEKKKADKNDITDGIRLALLNVFVKSVRNSAIDFNFVDSIGGVGTTWTPFAFEYLGKQISNVYQTALGEKTIWYTIIHSNSAMRQTQPFWESINPANS